MIDAATHGAPNWVDLSTPDVEAAVSFYRDLLGWSVERQTTPMGDYFVAEAGDREVAGMMAHGAGMEKAPAMWTTYFFVEDVDTAAERVVEHGGAVIAAPFDIPDGRVAVVTDPTGAMFALISHAMPEGHSYLAEDHGSVCWIELLTRDTQTAETFYADVFGWKAETQIFEEITYTTFQLNGEEVAGMMYMPATVPAEAPAHWSVYFAVDDCAAVEHRIAELGGQVLYPTTPTNTGKFAVAADPQGATFDLMEYTR